jgi:hypothetical protein
MKPEAQRIAIAEARGWKWYYEWNTSPQRYLLSNKPGRDCSERYQALPSRPNDISSMVIDGELPDYLNNRTEMQEALQMLTDAEWREMDEWLEKNGASAAIRAKTEQLAEGFLHIKNIWVNEPAKPETKTGE